MFATNVSPDRIRYCVVHQHDFIPDHRARVLQAARDGHASALRHAAVRKSAPRELKRGVAQPVAKRVERLAFKVPVPSAWTFVERVVGNPSVRSIKLGSVVCIVDRDWKLSPLVGPAKDGPCWVCVVCVCMCVCVRVCASARVRESVGA